MVVHLFDIVTHMIVYFSFYLQSMHINVIIPLSHSNVFKMN